jgi:hypothetical protein
MTTVNQFKNVLGLYPKGWRVPLTYRHEGERKEILVRLMGVQRHELDEGNQPKPDEPQPPGRPQPGRPAPGRPGAPAGPPAPPSPALKLYEAKAGYANFYFNRMERDRLLAAFARAGDFTPLTGEWTIEASGDVRDRAATLKAVIGEEKEKGGTTAHTMVRMVVGGVEFELEPLRLNQDNNALREPPGSGGLMEALYQYRQFLTTAMKGYAGEISHGGTEPFYAPAVPGKKPDYATGHVECEVINTRHGGIATKWYFNKTDGRLVGFEVTTDREEDPCEVFVSDYRPVQGRQLPHRLEIHSGDKRYASLTVTNYQLK